MVYWYDVLIQCIDTVYWYSVLIRCIYMVYWYGVLIRCNDTIHWYSILIRCVNTVNILRSPTHYTCNSRSSPCLYTLEISNRQSTIFQLPSRMEGSLLHARHIVRRQLATQEHRRTQVSEVQGRRTDRLQLLPHKEVNKSRSRENALYAQATRRKSRHQPRPLQHAVAVAVSVDVIALILLDPGKECHEPCYR